MKSPQSKQLILKFYREEGGWFVDLPEWQGDKSELAMVCGADLMLDIISQGEEDVYLTLSTSPFDKADCLTRTSICKDISPVTTGAWYIMHSYKGIVYDLPIWLCDVTLFVFGDFPESIYIT